MANTRSLCLCTLLVATTLMQGCRGQCDGQVKVLVATEEAKTFGPPDFSNTRPDECKWLIKAEDGYIVYLRVMKKNLDDNGRSNCSGDVSLYYGTHPEMAKLITTFCIDTDQVFSTYRQNMYVHYHSGTAGWLDFTMEYWADDIPGNTIISCGGGDPAPAMVSLLLVGLLICSIILCCCYCCCRSAKRRASPPSQLTSPAPFCDTAPLSSHTHHDDQGLVVISTRGNSSTSRTDGIRASSPSAVPLLSAPQPEPSNVGRRSLADSPPAYDDLGLVVIYTRGNSSTSRTDGIRASLSSAVPLLSAPQPEASNMGRRSFADSPPAYDDLELVVISTVGRNSSLSRPGGVHTSSSRAVPVTAAPPLEDFNMDRRSLVDSPPAYDAVVTSDINRSEENPQETLTVRLPSYSEAVAIVNMATKPK